MLLYNLARIVISDLFDESMDSSLYVYMLHVNTWNSQIYYAKQLPVTGFIVHGLTLGSFTAGLYVYSLFLDNLNNDTYL